MEPKTNKLLNIKIRKRPIQKLSNGNSGDWFTVRYIVSVSKGVKSTGTLAFNPSTESCNEIIIKTVYKEIIVNNTK